MEAGKILRFIDQLVRFLDKNQHCSLLKYPNQGLRQLLGDN